MWPRTSLASEALESVRMAEDAAEARRRFFARLNAGRTDCQGSNASALAVGSWVVVSVGVAAVAALGGASGLGAAAGILYAAGDVATKAAVHGGTSLAFVPVLLVCHGLAFAAMQLSFQRGGALETAGIATLLTNALPIAAGMLVFGEGLGSRPALRLLAFSCTVVGATLLARKPAPEVPTSPSPAGPVPFD